MNGTRTYRSLTVFNISIFFVMIMNIYLITLVNNFNSAIGISNSVSALQENDLKIPANYPTILPENDMFPMLI